jgi:hypothetical protein
MKCLPILAAAALGTGCTSMFKVMTDDPVRATNIRRDKDERDAIATISLDASRRNVIVRLTEDRMGQFCAEAPPDTASAIESLIDANVRARAEAGERKAEGEAGLKDVYKSNVVVVAKRTELLDIYRTGTYALCQYYINGAIDGNALRQSFDSLTRSVVERVPRPPAEASAAADTGLAVKPSAAAASEAAAAPVASAASAARVAKPDPVVQVAPVKPVVRP